MKKILFLTVLLANIIVFGQIPNYVPTNGLIGYWPFNGNANDQSGNLNNGTAVGPVSTTDRFNNANAAYSFNGTSDYIIVPNNSMLSGFNDITISVWFNANQFSGIQGLVAKWFFTLNCGSNTDNYNASFSGNGINFATNNNNGYGYYSPQTFSSNDLNVWKHFAFVSKASGGISIYINGVLSGTSPTTGNICNSINDLFFGAVNPTTRFFNGKLDDIGIWNRALTSCEISGLYLGNTVNPASSNAAICAGNTATLTAGVNTTNYLWNTGATTSAIVVSPTVTTTYTVAETNTLTGCTYTGAVTQSITSLNMSAFTSNSIICPGNSATLTVNGAATTYFWNTSATSSIIVVSPTTTTSYTVFGTNAVTGCTNTASVTQSVALCAGIENFNLNNALTIYPNPTSGIISLEASIEHYDVEVINCLGKLVYKTRSENNNTLIDISEQKNGLYFVRLITDNGIVVKKINKE